MAGRKKAARKQPPLAPSPVGWPRIVPSVIAPLALTAIVIAIFTGSQVTRLRLLDAEFLKTIPIASSILSAHQADLLTRATPAIEVEGQLEVRLNSKYSAVFPQEPAEPLRIVNLGEPQIFVHGIRFPYNGPPPRPEWKIIGPAKIVFGRKHEFARGSVLIVDGPTALRILPHEGRFALAPTAWRVRLVASQPFPFLSFIEAGLTEPLMFVGALSPREDGYTTLYPSDDFMLDAPDLSSPLLLHGYRSDDSPLASYVRARPVDSTYVFGRARLALNVAAGVPSQIRLEGRAVERATLSEFKGNLAAISTTGPAQWVVMKGSDISIEINTKLVDPDTAELKVRIKGTAKDVLINGSSVHSFNRLFKRNVVVFLNSPYVFGVVVVIAAEIALMYLRRRHVLSKQA